MNYNMIAYLLGNILHIEGILLSVPVVVAFCYREEYSATVFIASALVCLITGAVLQCREPEDKRIYGREGFIVAALSWIVMSFFGAIPYYLTNSIPGFIN